MYKLLITRTVCRIRSDSPRERVSPWLQFLAYLVMVRALRDHPSTEQAVLRTLIVVVGLVLVVVALCAAGAPEVVGQVLQHWPLTP